MPNKKYLSKLSKEEYEYILAGQGLILGTFVAEDLIAIRALLIPKLEDPEHLGYEVGLSQDQFSNLIYQEISLVHPDYRGNRLQQLLARLIMEQLDEQFPNVRYISCTVAPFNIPSLLDKFRQDMYIKSLKVIYDHQLRYIFFKDLKEKLSLKRVKQTKVIPMNAIKEQQDLLAKGWIGISLKEKEGSYFVKYIKC